MGNFHLCPKCELKCSSLLARLEKSLPPLLQLTAGMPKHVGGIATRRGAGGGKEKSLVLESHARHIFKQRLWGLRINCCLYALAVLWLVGAAF